MLRSVRGTVQGMDRRARLAAGLFVLAAGLIIAFRSRLVVPAALLGALSFLALSFRWPLPMLAAEMFLSTSAFKFLGVESWPHLIPGLPLDPPDIMVLAFFAVGALKLLARREQPLFLGPLLLFGLAAALSAILAPALGTQTLYDSLNGLRQLSGYLFYIGVVGAIDSPGRLRWLVRILFAFVLVTVGIQVLEALRGQQFTTTAAPFNEYYAAQASVSVGSLEAPYLWNRAIGYLVVGLFVALGQALWAGSTAGYAVALTALVGYGVQLIRQWYVFIALGGLVLLLLLRRNRLKVLLGLGALVLAAAVGLGAAAASGARLPLASLWLGRVGTLARFGQEPNFVIRVQSYLEELRLFVRAPLFGHGPGSANRLGAMGPFIFFDADTGMSNTLLQYGIVGTLAAWVLIGAYLRRAHQLYRTVAGPLAQGHAAGLVALGAVMVAGYLTSQDFITYIELAFATGLALALVDRLHAFAPREG